MIKIKRKKILLSSVLITAMTSIPLIIVSCNSANNEKQFEINNVTINLNENAKFLTAEDFSFISKNSPDTFQSYFTISELPVFVNESNKDVKKVILFDSIVENEKIKIKLEVANKSKFFEFDTKNNSKNIMQINENNKLKLLTIGDSISSGFNAEYDFDLPGFYNKDTKEISGLSYGAFLAKYIQNFNSNLLGSYENYALSSSTIKNWLYLLDSEKYQEYNNEELVEEFENVYNLENKENNPQKNRLEEIFGNWKNNSSENNLNLNLTNLNNKIKEANLITLTLGANDFNLYEILTQLSNIFLNPNDSTDSIAKIIKLITENTEKISADLELLFSSLRSKNPTANITILSYPMPFARLSNMIDSLPGLENTGFNTKKILDSLNNSIKKAVDNFNTKNTTIVPINYVNIYNSEIWKNDSNKLTSNIFDIHPSTYGYQKIAQELLLKLGLPKYTYETYNDLLDKNLFGNKEYIEKDWNSFSQILKFDFIEFENKNDYNLYIDELINKVLNDEKNKMNLFNEENALINEYKDIKSDYNLAIKNILNYLKNNNLQMVLKEMLKNVLETNGKNAFINLIFSDPNNEKVADLVDNIFNNIQTILFNQNGESDSFTNIFNALLDSNFLLDYLEKIQKKINENSDLLTLESLKSIFISQIINIDLSEIFSIFKTIFSLDILKNENANLLKNIASDFIELFFISENNNIKELILTTLSANQPSELQETFKSTIETLIFTENNKNFLKNLLTNVLENVESWKNSANFDELIKNIIASTNIDAIIPSAKLVLSDLLKNDYIFLLMMNEIYKKLPFELKDSDKENIEIHLKSLISKILNNDSDFISQDNPLLNLLLENIAYILNGDFSKILSFFDEPENINKLLSYFVNYLEQNEFVLDDLKNIINIFLDNIEIKTALKDLVTQENVVNSISLQIFKAINVSDQTKVQLDTLNTFITNSIEAIFNDSDILNSSNPLIILLENNLISLLKGDFSNITNQENLNLLLESFTTLLENNSQLQSELNNVINLFLNESNLKTALKDLVTQENVVNSISLQIFKAINVSNQTKMQLDTLNAFITNSIEAIFNDSDILNSSNQLILLLENNLISLLKGDFSSITNYISESENFSTLLKDISKLLNNNLDLENSFEELLNTLINDSNLFYAIKKLFKDFVLESENLTLISNEIIKALELINVEAEDKLNIKKFIEQTFIAIIDDSEIITSSNTLVQYIKDNLLTILQGDTDDFMLQLSNYFSDNAINLIFELKNSFNNGTISGKILGDFINLLFEKSKINSPLYETLLNKNIFEGGSTGNLFELKEKITNIMDSMARSLFTAYKEYQTLAEDNTITNNPYYKALYRISTTMLLIGRYATNKLGFWNATSLSSSAAIIDGLKKANINELNQLVDDWIVGSDSYSFTYSSNYEKNQILWFLYYYEDAEGKNPTSEYAKYFGSMSYINVIINSLKFGNLINYENNAFEQSSDSKLDTFNLEQEFNINDQYYNNGIGKYSYYSLNKYYGYYLVNENQKNVAKYVIKYDISKNDKVVVNAVEENYKSYISITYDTKNWIQAWKNTLKFSTQNIKTLELTINNNLNGKSLHISSIKINEVKYNTDILIKGFWSFA